MKRELEIRKILIVDDEPDIRDILARIMRSLNIHSEQAENGKIALDLLSRGTFHAVLCDIMMPEMTGLECLAKAQIEGVTSPFIFVTGYEDRTRMLQAIRLGALDFISKPFDNREVADVVFRALEVGSRRAHMLREVENTDTDLFSRLKKEERLISIMRATNNQRRTL